MEVNMNKDKLIVAQVVFKGAIDLVVAGKIELDEISGFLTTNVDKLMKFQELPATTQPPFGKVVEPPKKYKYPKANNDSNIFCPHCKSSLYDNRETKTKATQPNFKCSNITDCGGGKPYNGKPQPWVSWSDEPTAEMQKEFVPPTQPVVNEDEIF